MTRGLPDLPTPLASLSLGTGQPVFTALALGALPAMGLAPQLSHGLQLILAIRGSFSMHSKISLPS